MAQQFGLVKSRGFEPPPVGKHPAILAEIVWEMVEDRRTQEMELKMFWCFQLNVKDNNNNRYIVDMEFYPGFSATNAVGKRCKSWSGSPKALTQEQLNQWRVYVNGSNTLVDKDGNPILDQDGDVQTKSYETVEEFLANYDREPPLVGTTAIVQIEHVESKVTGRTYAKISEIFPNAKVDSMGNAMRDAENQLIPAFELEIEDYMPRAQRQAEIRQRIADKEAKKNNPAQGASTAQAVKPKSKNIPF